MPEMLKSIARPLVQFDPLHPMSYLSEWYEQYMKQMRWVGAVAAAVLTFTVPMMLGAGPLGQAGHSLEGSRGALMFACGLLGLSLLFVCACLLVTYNWFVGVMHMLLRHSGPRMVQEGVLGESALQELLSYGTKSPAQAWGRRSLVLGWLAGIPFALGILVYVVVAFAILVP
jgi:hypothetical protein